MSGKSYEFEIRKLTSYNIQYPAFEYQMILNEFNVNGILRRSTVIGYYKNWDHAEEVKKNLEQLIKKQIKQAVLKWKID